MKIKALLLPIIMSILGIGGFFYRLLTIGFTLPGYLIIASYFLLVWLVIVIKRINLPFSLLCCYYGFLLIALLLGSTMYFYDTFSWWDIFAHTTWGYIGCFVGIVLIHLVDKKNIVKDNKVLFWLICFLFSMACASIWEVFEFTSDLIFDIDVQHVATTGVGDTMGDIICNLIGAVIFSVHYMIDMLALKGKFYNNVISSFERIEEGEK